MEIAEKQKECLINIITWAISEGYSIDAEEKELIDKFEISEDRKEYVKGIAGENCFECTR
jgi:hypothetical protein